jgi:hypothetical protein
MERKVIVPSTMRDEKIFHGIHRVLKYISVVVCISASRDHVVPCVLSSQINDTVVWKLKSEGSRIGTESILEKREKPYTNAALFHEYTWIIFLPHIAKERSNLGLTDEPAILLMDNCSIQVRISRLRDRAAHRVNFVTFQPHTTNIFQCLDLSLFSILKEKINRKLRLIIMIRWQCSLSAFFTT